MMDTGFNSNKLYNWVEDVNYCPGNQAVNTKLTASCSRSSILTINILTKLK